MRLHAIRIYSPPAALLRDQGEVLLLLLAVKRRLETHRGERVLQLWAGKGGNSACEVDWKLPCGGRRRRRRRREKDRTCKGFFLEAIMDRPNTHRNRRLDPSRISMCVYLVSIGGVGSGGRVQQSNVSIWHAQRYPSPFMRNDDGANSQSPPSRGTRSEAAPLEMMIT